MSERLVLAALVVVGVPAALVGYITLVEGPLRSLTGRGPAGVIWKFMYDYRPLGSLQTGTVNGALTTLVPGFQPQAWLINQPMNNFALIVAAVWAWTGFCMVILSAGLKGIPDEVLEAARV